MADTDVEVRLADQEKINEFGRLNNRLMEIRADVKQLKADSEKLDDASTELMMAESGRIMLFIGEAFVEVSEDFAGECTGHVRKSCGASEKISLPLPPPIHSDTDCDKKQSALAARVEQFGAEEVDIVKRCEALKKELYARFGDSINLES